MTPQPSPLASISAAMREQQAHMARLMDAGAPMREAMQRLAASPMEQVRKGMDVVIHAPAAAAAAAGGTAVARMVGQAVSRARRELARLRQQVTRRTRAALASLRDNRPRRQRHAPPRPQQSREGPPGLTAPRSLRLVALVDASHAPPLRVHSYDLAARVA